MGLQALLIELLNVVMLLAGITGFLKWKEIKGSYWKWLPVYLVLLGGINVLAEFLTSQNLKLYNRALIIYFVIPGEFLFAYWLVLKKMETRLHKTLIWSGMGLYILVTLMEVWQKGTDGIPFLTISYTLGNIFLLAFILLYLWQLAVSEKVLYFYRERMFWVSVGMLFFWLGTLPYFGLYNLLSTSYPGILESYAWVMLGLNYLMYILFAASFIWGKEN